MWNRCLALVLLCGCAGADELEDADLDEEQTLSTEEALADGCFNFDKGALGAGLRYLRLPSFSWGGASQVVHAVRINNDNADVLGYRVSSPAASFKTTAQWASSSSDIKVAVNGDFRHLETTWGLWKSQGDVHRHDTGKPFLAFGKRGDDSAHPERIAVFWYGQGHGQLANHETPGVHALGGFPELVRDGQLTAPSDCPNYGTLCHLRHPRTATGVSHEGRYSYFVVVEGRLPGAAGMTTVELGKLMKNKVCADYATNQDGGGSSTMWIRGRGVVNRCSDSSGCRHLVNHVGVRRAP